MDVADDHCLAIEKIVWEFYVNLHQRCGDSFRTWFRGKTIEVTPHSSARSLQYLVYMT